MVLPHAEYGAVYAVGGIKRCNMQVRIHNPAYVQLCLFAIVKPALTEGITDQQLDIFTVRKQIAEWFVSQFPETLAEKLLACLVDKGNPPLTVKEAYNLVKVIDKHFKRH